MLRINQQDENSASKTLERLRLELINELQLMQSAAEIFFESHACSKADVNFENYKLFYNSYFELHDQLQPDNLGNDSKKDLKELIVKAKMIAHDTKELFNYLSEGPKTGDETFDPIQDIAHKAGKISLYKSKYQAESIALPYLKTIGRVVTSFAMAAVGFIAGAIIGVGAGFILAVSSGPLAFEVGLPMMIGGGIVGGLVGAIAGFCWTWQSDFLNKDSPKPLDNKTISFANHASAFFPPPHIKDYVAYKNGGRVNDTLQHSHNLASRPT